MEFIADRQSATTTTMCGGPAIPVQLARVRVIDDETTAVVVDHGRV